MAAVTLSERTYRDKVMGCWYGKNASGPLGGPLERIWGQDEPFNIDWYPKLQEGGMPNDDLEIQLVWLQALVVGPWSSNAVDAVFQQLDMKANGLKAGTKYIAYVWVKTSMTSKTGRARLTIAAFDKNGNVVQYLFAHDETEAGQYGQSGTQDWQLHRVTWIPQQDVAYVTIQGVVGAYPSDGDADDEALFDGFVLVDANKVPAVLAETLVPKYTN